MKSKEISKLLELRDGLLTVKDWMSIVYTSPQIRELYLNKDDGIFHVKTDDGYIFKLRVLDTKEEKRSGKLK